MKILMRSEFDSFSAWGRAAIDVSLALSRAGATVVPLPTRILPGLPRPFTMLLERDPSGPYDAVLQFGHEQDMPDSLEALSRYECPKVALFAAYPQDEKPIDATGWDMVIGMTADAMNRVEGPPARMASLGIDVDTIKATARPRVAPVRVLAFIRNADEHDAVLKAWRRATEEGAEGALHVHGYAPDEGDGSVTYSTHNLSGEELQVLYAEHHAMVVLDGGCGIERPPGEFAASGGMLIGAKEGALADLLFTGTSMSFVPGDFPALVSALRWTLEHPEQVSRMGEAASRNVAAASSWDTIGDLLARHISQAGRSRV